MTTGFINMSVNIWMVCILIFVFLTTWLMIKRKYGFWYYQPVFHLFDIHYNFFSPQVIRKNLPVKIKFTRTDLVKVKPFQEWNLIQLHCFCRFVLQEFYVQGDNRFVPQRENILPYFEGHNEPCFLSLMQVPELLQEEKNHRVIQSQKMVGVMTSRPIELIFFPSKTTVPLYYVDYLCVAKSHRKKGVAPQIIQTHEYVQRHSNTRRAVSLFKREGDMTGIVPLCAYTASCFSLYKMIKSQSKSNLSYGVVLATKQTLHLVMHFLKENQWKMDCMGWPSLQNIMALIETSNLFLSFFKVHDQIQSLYVFKKSCMEIQQGREALTCVGSLKSDKQVQSMFVHGFYESLHLIVEQQNQQKKGGFYLLVVEAISDNVSLLEDILKNTKKPLHTAPCAYFLYNYLHTPLSAEKVLMIL